MIGDRNFLDEPTKSDIRVFENIGKVANDQEDECITGYLIDYIYLVAKSVQVKLELTATISTTDSAIQKKFLGLKSVELLILEPMFLESQH